MFVRHGEKPGEGTKPHGVNHHGEHDGHSLSVLGWTRAGAGPGLSAPAPARAPPHAVRPGPTTPPRPTEGAKRKRELPPAAPTAKRLKLDIEDGHTHGNEAELAHEVLGRAEPTLVVWHHGTMAKIIRHFPLVNPEDVPKHWPDERFDLIWLLLRQDGEPLRYRFVAVPQMLLADDLETA